ncbi:SPFH domain-containing protein [Mycoplasma sp. Pen4]|nr:SPFH domain-containing protein [Mycoplasma sp. Pen4]
MIAVVEPGTSNIDSAWLPIVSSGTQKWWSGNAYPVEFYFINKRLKLDMKWGTPSSFSITDPKYALVLDLRARGQFGLAVNNYQYLLDRLVGSFDNGSYLTFDFIKNQLRGWINQNIKRIISAIIIQKEISYFDILPRLDEINDFFILELNKHTQTIGMDVVSSSIEDIGAPEETKAELNKLLMGKAKINILGDDYYKVRELDNIEHAAKNEGISGTILGLGVANMMGQGMVNSMQYGQRQFSQSMSEVKEIVILACPSCAAKNNEKSKFCIECGNKLQPSCKACNASLLPKSKFCIECGERV